MSKERAWCQADGGAAEFPPPGLLPAINTRPVGPAGRPRYVHNEHHTHARGGPCASRGLLSHPPQRAPCRLGEVGQPRRGPPPNTAALPTTDHSLGVWACRWSGPALPFQPTSSAPRAQPRDTAFF